MSHQPSPDLTHADWWIRIHIKMLQKVDQSLRFSVIKHANNTQHLHIENISEATLPKLCFLTNTDQNNNYGYLEHFHVYTTNDNSKTPIPIPGLNELIISIWNNSDTDAFLDGKKIQTPFLHPLNNPVTKKPMSIKSYIDMITSTIPWSPKTAGQTQYYAVVVNPDIDPITNSQPKIPQMNGTLPNLPGQTSSTNQSLPFNSHILPMSTH